MDFKLVIKSLFYKFKFLVFCWSLFFVVYGYGVEVCSVDYGYIFFRKGVVNLVLDIVFCRLDLEYLFIFSFSVKLENVIVVIIFIVSKKLFVIMYKLYCN